MVVLQYSHLINDYTSINLTKLDVLDNMDTIKIGVEYFHNCVPLDSFPGIEEFQGGVRRREGAD